MAVLEGHRCRVCRRTIYPGASPCIACGASDVQRVALTPAGVLETFTRNAMGAAVGQVRLDDGVHVLGALRIDAPEVGQRVAVQVEGEVPVVSAA